MKATRLLSKIIKMGVILLAAEVAMRAYADGGYFPRPVQDGASTRGFRVSQGVVVKAVLMTLLLTIIGAAHADTWEMPNPTGGKIVATTRECPIKGGEGLLYVYSLISSREVLHGCWTSKDRNIVIIWNNGQMTVHNVESFTPVETGKPYIEPTPMLTKPTESET